MDVLHGAISIVKSIFGIGCVDTRLQFKRLYVCATCEKLKARRCIVCGCYLIHKTKLKDEHCPLDKW